MVTTRGMHMKRKANVSSADTEVHIKGGRPGKRLKSEGGNLDGEKGTADAAMNGSSLMVKMRKSKRKVQGRLADLMNMPIDIFEEVRRSCCHYDLMAKLWQTTRYARIFIHWTYCI
ncbi:hypothetical protein FRC02_011685 [Tulasnella sp. 418]|nr:hypothetical protein FRC02_011685 [Tulasnella sp. 418]